jgi:hypothetical protein
MSTSWEARQISFLHQDGFTLSAIVGTLLGHGVLERLQDGQPHTVGELAQASHARRGPLHVALRCLSAQGWLRREGLPASDALRYQLTPQGLAAAHLWPLYARAARFAWKHFPLEEALLGSPQREAVDELRALSALCARRWTDGAQVPSEMSRHHLDGAVLVPLVLALRRAGKVNASGLTDLSAQELEGIRPFFAALGWLPGDGVKWSAEGEVGHKYSLNYGIAGAYLPMFRDLAHNVFEGEPAPPRKVGTGESHVDRVTNVQASGNAHRRYFNDADEIILQLFDTESLETQPRFVADMGCGDGSWLQHIYEAVKTRTRRGQHLATHPLLMIGADYNQAALGVAKATLDRAGVPNQVLFGDITDPNRFAKDLGERGLSIADGLHIRSFIDHNRRYLPPRLAAANVAPVASGAYIDEHGEPIRNELVELDLMENLARWLPHVQRHGLVILEAHCVAPEIAANHLGDTHNVTFDTYHGLSKQYVVDFEVFLRAARRAGLEASPSHQRRYPSKLPFTAISLNRLVPVGSTGRS